MKKLFLFTVLLSGLAIGSSSCKKCTQCRVDYPTPRPDGTTYYEHPEICGNSFEVQSQEDRFYNAYNTVGTVTCKRK